MNSCTVAWPSRTGVMYVAVAVAATSAASSSGKTNQPTRSPGATVFENDEL